MEADAYRMSTFREKLLANQDGTLCFHDACQDGIHRVGKNGLLAIVSDRTRSAEYLVFEEHMLCHIPSAAGQGAYYPVPDTRLAKPVRAVLMDLDGTTVRSEAFWIWIIELTVRSLSGNPRFAFTEADLPFVSGHSVTEHLEYCLKTYCREGTVEDARRLYFDHTRREMALIAEGRGRAGAFTPTPGVAAFLRALKAHGIKIGLVTSGLYEKAYPEIRSAFETMGFPPPERFYDCIISAGYPLGQGGWGTLGELEPKPHPWLYAETGRIGLSLPHSTGEVVAVEDSAVGIHAIRLAGYTPIGIAGGNIEASGALAFCDSYETTFSDILRRILS